MLLTDVPTSYQYNIILEFLIAKSTCSQTKVLIIWTEKRAKRATYYVIKCLGKYEQSSTVCHRLQTNVYRVAKNTVHFSSLPHDSVR